jgi:predicted transcriptional regulator
MLSYRLNLTLASQEMNAAMSPQIRNTVHSADELSNRFQLMTFIGMQVLAVHAIGVAADLGLADKIGNQTLSVNELCTFTQADPSSLKRLLRALASMGIFHEEGDGRYRNTPLSNLIRRDVPDSLWGWANFFTSPLMTRPSEALSTSITTGQPVFSKVFGKSFMIFWPKINRRRPYLPLEWRRIPLSCLPEVLAAYDFSAKRIADIGGGPWELFAGYFI